MVATKLGGLFLIDLEELEAIKNVAGATFNQMERAYYQALTRTTVTFTKETKKILANELGASSQKLVKKRMHVKRSKYAGIRSEMRIWIGLDDIPIRYLKGRRKSLGSKKARRGAEFKPAAPGLASMVFPEGFVTDRFTGKRDIFTRTTNRQYPVTNPKIKISDRIYIKIDDLDVDEMYLKHFESAINNVVSKNLNVDQTWTKRRRR
jgi:hypothetical protein